MSQLNFDIFCLIFGKLPLEELLHFRLVCKEWRAWIDDFLAKTSVVLIMSEGKEVNIARLSLSMNLNLDVIFANRLRMPYSAMMRDDFNRCFHRMFPAVRQFYFIHNGDIDHRFIDLLRGWSNLETLALLSLPDELYDPLTDYLNCLESLRTLIIITGKTPPAHCFTPEAPFLYRVERLYLPATDWLPQLKPEVTANLIAFGYDEMATMGIGDFMLRNDHLALEALTLYVPFNWLERNTPIDGDVPVPVQAWKKTIRALEIVGLKYREFELTQQINEWKSLSVVRVGIFSVFYFRSLLAQAANFEHITELQIFFCFRSWGDLDQIAYLGDAFPPMMRSVKLIRIRPRGKIHAEKLRLLQPAIEKLPYPVRIEQYIEENFEPMEHVMYFYSPQQY